MKKLGAWWKYVHAVGAFSGHNIRDIYVVAVLSSNQLGYIAGI